MRTCNTARAVYISVGPSEERSTLFGEHAMGYTSALVHTAMSPAVLQVEGDWVGEGDYAGPHNVRCGLPRL